MAPRRHAQGRIVANFLRFYRRNFSGPALNLFEQCKGDGMRPNLMTKMTGLAALAGGAMLCLGIVIVDVRGPSVLAGLPLLDTLGGLVLD